MIITNLDKSSKIIITQNIYTVDTSYKNVSGHRRRCFWDPFVNWGAWYTCPQSFKTAGPAPIDYAYASWTENYIPIYYIYQNRERRKWFESHKWEIVRIARIGNSSNGTDCFKR